MPHNGIFVLAPLEIHIQLRQQVVLWFRGYQLYRIEA